MSLSGKLAHPSRSDCRAFSLGECRPRRMQAATSVCSIGQTRPIWLSTLVWLAIADPDSMYLRGPRPLYPTVRQGLVGGRTYGCPPYSRRAGDHSLFGSVLHPARSQCPLALCRDCLWMVSNAHTQSRHRGALTKRFVFAHELRNAYWYLRAVKVAFGVHC